MKNYFNGVAPLVKSERYIDHKEDLITLRSSRDRAWLDWFVDKILIKLSKHRCGGFVLVSINSSNTWQCSQYHTGCIWIS